MLKEYIMCNKTSVACGLPPSDFWMKGFLRSVFSVGSTQVADEETCLLRLNLTYLIYLIYLVFHPFFGP